MTTSQQQPVVVLSRALDQAGDVLAAIREEDWDKPTPCGEWTVRDLAGHLAAAPEHFLHMARGEDVDWAAGADVADGGWAGHFRSAADDLIHHWHAQPAEQVGQADWQSAEIGVHTWDLLQGLGRQQQLDDEVAERGLAFMQQGLTDDNRGGAFAPEVPAPSGADAYGRLAAFSGRTPLA